MKFKYLVFWMNDDLPHPEKCKNENIIETEIMLDRKLDDKGLSIAEKIDIISQFQKEYPHIKKAHSISISWNGKCD